MRKTKNQHQRTQRKSSPPLFEAALAMLSRAYSPYSKFRVGAAVETRSGRIFAGCNVENASLGLTICAERAAVCAAVAAGEREFLRVVIVTSTGRLTPPCGACRQFMKEFSPKMAVIMMAGRRSKRTSLETLLPGSFGSGLLVQRGE
ncbi:MAG: cytidine deaminase [Planctomycetes bacterium]|nr:cytidine deaminase [Planctomycetota bacterium]